MEINTVSELLSNQLSIYLTEILSEVFTDVGFISGVDFKFNYSVYEADEETGPVTNLYGTELELGTKFDLFDDRLSLDVGEVVILIKVVNTSPEILYSNII